MVDIAAHWRRKKVVLLQSVEVNGTFNCWQEHEVCFIGQISCCYQLTRFAEVCVGLAGYVVHRVLQRTRLLGGAGAPQRGRQTEAVLLHDVPREVARSLQERRTAIVTFQRNQNTIKEIDQPEIGVLRVRAEE